MKIELFDFQQDALEDLKLKLKSAKSLCSTDNPQAISFSAPTGAGKTIVMTSLFENILFGEVDFEAQPDATILWVSDIPELNEQTRFKIEGKSDRIRVRQMTTIDASFDSEYLEDGHIYFINTQKLGTDKLLTQKGGDSRQYTIWETLTNTAYAKPDKFYVVIDEAHRGMRGRGEEKAKTIMQRFLLGSDEDGLCNMPLVIGISATPRRFEELLSGTIHTVHKVYVPAEDVRKSGLLKDRILIHYPDSEAEMSLLSEAATRWKQIENQWEKYCKLEGEHTVWPILVVQVEDRIGDKLTKTDLARVLSTIEGAIDRPFLEKELAHAFNDAGELTVGTHKIRRIEASRIQEDTDVGIVLFKMSLSTGWDCPRAEVMMSFRRAEDHTYIAQLLGRMVRTPLARRIEAEADLNDVHLFLPRYDRDAVDAVIADLKNVEDVPPAEVGTSRDLVTLRRRNGSEKIFKASEKLVTYRVNAVREQSGLKRLMGLGRRLTHDEIDDKALEYTKSIIIKNMDIEINKIKKAGAFKAKSDGITKVSLQTITVDRGTGIAEEVSGYNIEASSVDIDRRFNQAGRLLGNGLHMDYWKANMERDANDVKVEVIILAGESDAMRALETFAKDDFDKLFEKYKRKIATVSEKTRKQYDALRLAASEPETIDWRLPESIDFSRSQDASVYEKHLYVEDGGTFRADLGAWEEAVLVEEIQNKNVIAWLRNVTRKPWSLEIPYRSAGKIKPMFPDMIIVRQEKDDFIFDILEPHDPSRSDNFSKAVGLAEFADKHWNLFGRIQLIRKKRGPDGSERFYRLDMNKEATRRKVRAITSNDQLDQLFDAEATLD